MSTLNAARSEDVQAAIPQRFAGLVKKARKKAGNLRNRIKAHGMKKYGVVLFCWLALSGLALSDSSNLPGPSVLYYFKSDCDACRRQGPEVEKLYASLVGKGLTVLGVSLDDPETFSKVNASYPIIRLDDWNGADAFGRPSHIPAIFYVDKSGKLIARAYGYFTAEYLEGSAKPLLD